MPAEGLEPPTNGLQNRCSTTELSRRRKERAILSRGLYRSRRPHSTDGWLATFTTTHGTGPPPPGLHRGRFDPGTAADATGAGRGTAAGRVAAEEAADLVCGEGAFGDGVEAQGCTLIGELSPRGPGSRSETSFSGTAVELFGSDRSSQYTVPGRTRSAIAAVRPIVPTSLARRWALSRSV